ncbi:MAG: M28 family peptidase [Kofleriaceae bacterium]
MKLAPVLVAAFVACDSPGMDLADAARPDAPPGCTRPPLDAAFLRPLLVDALAGLPAPRATVNQRIATRTFLADQLAAIGFPAQLHDYAGGTNVFAVIPATLGSERGIIVGAHYDTVDGSPGANDNASGTVAVLAIARFLADVPCRTAPVTVVLFDQEELGLFGSRAFAQMLQPADIRAVHTIDQISWDDDGDRILEVEQPTLALEQEYRAAAQVAGATISLVSAGGTDHEAFRDQGFAAVGLTEEFTAGDTSPFRHLAGDTIATVDVDYLVLATQLAAQVVMSEIAP